ncbi:VCBS repeat-containing protein [Myxococcota bacterium]|nr:VCBS repeat-containing protein [Myxococcota bacterium]MBU1537687.1 VCBS repeat-containing protein [Myxococcota bacterium]
MRFPSHSLFYLFVSLFILGAVPSCDDDELPPGYCGNGILNKGEECDEGISNSNLSPDACREDCTRPFCGDGIKDSGEACDGFQLDQQTCSLQGFDRGVLSCTDACTFNTTQCSLCGNSRAEASEDCDFSDLGGMTCQTLGFTGGSLGCLGDCSFDQSSCAGGCGNSVVELSEECDGDSLETTCEDHGFTGGVLSCSDSCLLDFSDCIGGCGNGIIEEGESCDDGNNIPGDGCYNCRAPSGTYTLIWETTFPYTPSAMDVGDFDGDGAGDILIGTISEDLSGGTMALFLSTENYQDQHNLASGPMVNVLGARVDPQAPESLLGVSLTSDGTASYHYFSDYLGAGNVVSYPDRPRAIIAADVDGIPGEEVVFTGWPSQTLVQFSFAMGGFYSLLGIGGDPGDLITMDFNNNGVIDFMTVRSASQLVAMLLGLGDMTFTYHSARYVGGRPSNLASADLNLDGYEDLLVTDTTNPYLYLLKGGSGGLSGAYFLELTNNPHRIAIANLNHDAVPDLVLSFPDSGEVVVYEATGDFTYSEAFSMNGCHIPIALRVADMNGDGLNDLVVACTQEKKVVVLLADPM